MAVARLARFHIDPADAEEMLARRATLIDAVRRSHRGLDEARLTRIDEQTWLDIWRWESTDLMNQALAGAPALAEAGRAFALTRDMSAEVAEIVDER